MKAILSLSLSLYLVLIETWFAVESSAFVAVTLKYALSSPRLLEHSQMTASSFSMSNVSRSTSNVPPYLTQWLTIG